MLSYCFITFFRAVRSVCCCIGNGTSDFAHSCLPSGDDKLWGFIKVLGFSTVLWRWPGGRWDGENEVSIWPTLPAPSPLSRFDKGVLTFFHVHVFIRCPFVISILEFLSKPCPSPKEFAGDATLVDLKTLQHNTLCVISFWLYLFYFFFYHF